MTVAERLDEPTGEIVVAQPTTLFATDDPLKVVSSALRVADVLGDVLKQRRLTITIGGGRRQHVLVEGWTLLGSMLGVFAEIEWTRELPNGFEARALAHTLSGARVGSAEAQCTRSESLWRLRDDYALRSMAQTRAVAKALRLPLGFVVELAGYSATPAEELTAPAPRESAPPGNRQPTLRELREEIEAARQLRGITDDQLAEIAKLAGVSGRANGKQLRAILAAIEQVPVREEEVTNDDEDDDLATARNSEGERAEGDRADEADLAY